MDIHHLKIFISVHHNNSFSKASRELHISQPTISEHIKNLENELDCILFDRLGRSILPTAKAEILLPLALQVVEEMTKLKEAIYTENQQISGDIIISASTIPGTYLLPKMAAKFKQKHPKSCFQILINDTAQSIHKVENHNIHLAVTGGITTKPTLKTTIFFEDQLVCVACPKLTATSSHPLHDLPILIREQGSGTRRAMETILKQAHVAITEKNLAATLGSTAAIKEALLAGFGFSIISKIAVKGELESGLLTSIDIPDSTMTRPILFISHKKRTLPRRYQAFIDMILKESEQS